MERLYLAQQTNETLFISDDRDDLQEKGRLFIKEDYHGEVKTIITEILSYSQIPQDWRNDIFIYGTDENITAATALESIQQSLQLIQDPEYNTYLMLHERFKNIK
jgi:hypothetical protein